MPPRPISWRTMYGPIRRPSRGSPRSGGSPSPATSRSAAASNTGRSVKSPERSCAENSDPTAARNARFPPHAWSRNALRSPCSRATAASNTSRARAHSLGFTETPDVELACQPCFRERPSALDGGRRYAQRLRRLLDGEAAEKSDFNHPRQIRIELGETRQRVVQRLEV